MDTLKAFAALAHRARGETPPRTHVLRGVLSGIRSHEENPIVELSIVAVVSMAAAALIIALAFAMGNGATEPLLELFSPLQVTAL